MCGRELCKLAKSTSRISCALGRVGASKSSGGGSRSGGLCALIKDRTGRTVAIAQSTTNRNFGTLAWQWPVCHKDLAFTFPTAVRITGIPKAWSLRTTLDIHPAPEILVGPLAAESLREIIPLASIHPKNTRRKQTIFNFILIGTKLLTLMHSNTSVFGKVAGDGPRSPGMAIYLDGRNEQKLVVKSIFEDLKHPDKRSMRVNE